MTEHFHTILSIAACFMLVSDWVSLLNIMFLELVSKNYFDSVNNIKIIIHSSIKLEFLMHNIIINCWLTRSKVQPTGQNNIQKKQEAKSY